MRLSCREALNRAAGEETRRDPSVCLIGEEVGCYQGAFTVSGGGIAAVGLGRVIDTPNTEAGCTGWALGPATADLRPIIELMPMNFGRLALDEIGNNPVHPGLLVHRYGPELQVRRDLDRCLHPDRLSRVAKQDGKAVPGNVHGHAGHLVGGLRTGPDHPAEGEDPLPRILPPVDLVGLSHRHGFLRRVTGAARHYRTKYGPEYRRFNGRARCGEPQGPRWGRAGRGAGVDLVGGHRRAV